MSRAERLALYDRDDPELPGTRQCCLMTVSRSSVYRPPAPASDEDLAIMALIDRQYLARPYYGSRRMAAWLATQGHRVNRKRVQRLMRLYLVAILDWHSRAVLAWRLSNTLGADFCVEALEEALARFGRPEIFNTDQGSQFTSDDFTGVLRRHEVTISMDGKGRCMDNVFIERLWRSLKYEEVYLHAYGNVAAAKAGIGAWLVFYNEERQHQSHGYRTPRQVYEAQCRWICGRSALPTGCASPTSRASSKSGEMLAFAHIPTGTTTNTRIDQKGFDGKVTSASMAIGADIEIRGATP